jgi:hypothetical protein
MAPTNQRMIPELPKQAAAHGVSRTMRGLTQATERTSHGPGYLNS